MFSSALPDTEAVSRDRLINGWSRFFLVLGVFALLGMGSGRVHAQIPSNPNRLVLDLGEFLEPVEERALEQKLRAYNDSTSTQIVVVSVQDLGGLDGADFALRLGREWGVGQEGRDNGLIILLSRAERHIEIATGYGMEGSVPDALASRIIREVMTPSFRKGQFYVGINSAVDVIMAAAAGEFDALPQSTSSRDEGINPALIYMLMIFLYFLFTALRHRGNGGKGGKRRKSYRRGHSGDLPIIFWGGMHGSRKSGGFGGGGFGGGGFGGGGFGGFGGGGFGGGGAGGGW